MRSATQRLSLALTLALGCTAACADVFRPVTAVIDPTMEQDAAMGAVEMLGATLAESEYVKLDLQIVLAVEDGGTPRVNMVRGNSESTPLDCNSEFGRIDVAGAELYVYVADIYTHLLLSLRFGDEDGGIGYTVACTTRGDLPVLAVSGRFYVSHVNIPEAYDIQLVAVQPW